MFGSKLESMGKSSGVGEIVGRTHFVKPSLTFATCQFPEDCSAPLFIGNPSGFMIHNGAGVTMLTKYIFSVMLSISIIIINIILRENS